MKVSLIAEGALIAIYFLWQHFLERPGLEDLSWNSVVIGVISTIPLFILNWLFFGNTLKKFTFQNQFQDFKENIINPLVQAIDLPVAIAVSILAGLGEELFFRGTLLFETGIIISSALFSLVHFGSQIKRYFGIVLVYFAIGLYFACLKNFTDGLWAPIISHSVYDFIAILFLKSRLK